jgi:hypothetical protein
VPLLPLPLLLLLALMLYLISCIPITGWWLPDEVGRVVGWLIKPQHWCTIRYNISIDLCSQ